MELGRRAWPHFFKSFMKLWNMHGTQPRYARIPDDFEAVVKNGGGIVGSPGTIREQVSRMANEAGANYFPRRDAARPPRLAALLQEFYEALEHPWHAAALRPHPRRL